MKLSTNTQTEMTLSGGTYYVSTALNSGTASLSLSLDKGVTFATFESNSLTDGTLVAFDFPAGILKATVTGAAVVDVVKG